MIKESYRNTQYFNSYYNQEPILETDVYSDEYRNTFSYESNEDGWEAHGRLQLDMLIRNGLRRDMKLLEIGCGFLRGGSHIIDYLDSYNYYGIEVNRKTLFIGLNNELRRKNLQYKVKEENFILTDYFDLTNFNTQFDFGFANSVFTSLPLNHLIYFLSTSQSYFKKNAKIIFSFWICSENKNISDIVPYNSGGKTKFTNYLSPPYFIKKEDLYSICNRSDINWSVKQIEGIYQMNQSFFLFERL